MMRRTMGAARAGVVSSGTTLASSIRRDTPSEMSLQAPDGRRAADVRRLAAGELADGGGENVPGRSAAGLHPLVHGGLDAVARAGAEDDEAEQQKRDHMRIRAEQADVAQGDHLGVDEVEH